MPFAAVAGAAVSGGIGLLGSSMQSNAASKGSRDAALAQLVAQDRLRQDLQPWAGAGRNALMVSSDLAGANGPDAATAAMQNFYTSPGYQFRLDEGMRGVDAAAAAQGMLRSGATLKREQAFAQGLASSEFDNYYNRLFGLSKLGEAAAAGQGAAAMDTGRGIAATEIAGANAQSSIYGNAASALGGTANTLMNNQAFQKWLGGSSTPAFVDPTGGYTTSPGLQFQAPGAPPIQGLYR